MSQLYLFHLPTFIFRKVTSIDYQQLYHRSTYSWKNIFCSIWKGANHFPKLFGYYLLRTSICLSVKCVIRYVLSHPVRMLSLCNIWHIFCSNAFKAWVSRLGFKEFRRTYFRFTIVICKSEYLWYNTCFVVLSLHRFGTIWNNICY